MGHRLSKSILTGSNVATNKCQRKRSSTKNNTESEFSETELSITSSNLENTGPTINVITDTQTFCIETRADSNSSANGPRQIIIKIQLAKMEPGDNETTTSSTLSLDGISGSNNNLNVERSNLTVNAISFRRNIACDQENEIKLNNLNVGSSMMVASNNNNNNNNFVSNFMAVPYIEEDNDEARTTNVQNFNIMVRQMGNCQIVDNISDSRQGKNNNNGSGSNRSSTSSSEFSDAITYEVEEECSGPSRGATTACLEDAKNHCCRRKKSKESTSSGCSTPSTSSACASKWICCKCTCRDALKKLRPSCSKKQLPVNELPSNATNSKSLASSSELPRPHFDQLSMWSPRNDVIIPLASAHSSHLAMWSPGNDVIIPLASPQIVVVQYPPISSASQIVKLAPIDEHALRLMTGDLAIPTTPDSSNSMAVSPCSTASSATTPNGTVVHSQVDYKHWLVPDLERITKSTYYWGKMDRYEAERLLEGKPEGTFLLRDSAQEEYLFSVTFRKYGRSLHARIEQFNHQFSFDCHDPGVYIAPTVTGLLEHYKDPSIVMFFEPMLTIPLHRNKTFSLQQLCRATIVSQTTYDGISELEIPVRLKSYLKEYHYKQRVRKTDFDEPFYTCS